ncbi:HepT-like ribonuclease domain-containing protein [Candidatus Chloroploca asiatica]
MVLLSVGEAFRQINEKTQGEFLKQYPEIPWRAVIGMRNILAHDYFDVNEKVIFNTCEAHIMPLMDTVRRMLADLETDS